MLQVPRPVVSAGTVLVDVRASLLSAGTERTKVQTAKKSLLGKARQRPDQVAQVVEKARNDGIRETVRTVRARLEQPSVLGYSAAGIAVAVGADVRGVAAGDRVAVGGADAVHAEVDRVPANLCVRLPDAVSFEDGCFACVGSIALHGVRQAGVVLGERVAIVGLGLVGQLTALLLRAAGCTVVGIDLDRDLIAKARDLGGIDFGFEREQIGEAVPPDAAGCDAVIVTAATPSNDPIELAPRLCRDRGRVVIVGDVGLALSRAPFYEKEIDLRLSRSYGPGRYDRAYEENGQDYPIGYVRWTEGRNMAAIVELIAAGRLPVGDLVTARFAVDDAPTAYERLSADGSSPLGVVIEYEPSPEPAVELGSGVEVRRAAAGSLDRASLIGAGSFAQRVIVPGLRAAGFALDTVASASGVSARGLVEQSGEGEVGTPEEALASDAGLLVVATRHASHADLAERGLRAGKAVFVEKPPCLSREELELLSATRNESGGLLAVGFNRRHAPLAIKLREHVAVAGHPLEVLIRVSAGRLPADHWLNDPNDGGGRLLGEGCHFVDLACWLVGTVPTTVWSTVQPLPGESIKTAGRFVVSLGFADGSLATIIYGDGNATAVPKELVEVHGGGRSGILDDFRGLRLFDGRTEKKLGGRSQDKGHAAQFEHLRRRLTSAQGDPGELDPLATMAITLTALENGGQTG
ncbi:MAG TPA: bi-domain-containing oxidoreductase [Solirubrobacterales bacterium]|nr:bi-domain-containing oxidoreductase [Solirubrobacterales bacterium]